jgi:hypothetical protein
MQTDLDATKAKFDAVDAKEAGLQADRTDAYAALDAISDKYGLLGACVESKSGGDAGIIGRAGFDVVAARTPVGPLGRVMNLVLSEGDHSGTLDWMCKPLRGASAYELWISPDPMSDTSWKFADTATKSSGTLKNLTSGDMVWVQVRGKGADPEPGEFSDPAKKTVP